MTAFVISGANTALDTTAVTEVAPATGDLNDNLRKCITNTGKLRIIISS